MDEVNVVLTEADTIEAGFPCSDSAGSDIPDVAEIEVIDDGE